MPEPTIIRTPSDTQAAIDAGKQLGTAVKPHMLPGHDSFVIVPEGYAVESLRPLRIVSPDYVAAEPQFKDASSFVGYVERFSTDDTLIFADAKSLTLTAVLDYHRPDGTAPPAWCAHRATLCLEHAPEWRDWAAKDRKTLTQVEFAEFLEDHLSEIVDPSASILQDAILKIKMVRTTGTKSIRNLSTGEVHLSYFDEERDAEDTTTVPRSLTLGLRYFKGGDRFKATARLRYRPGQQGGVTFTYLIDRLDEIAETSFSEVCKRIAEDTELPVLAGSP